MAKLNNESSVQFAAAVTAISLGTGKRLIRNFHYYRKETPDIITREECRHIYREIRLNVFGLQNLYLNESKSNADTSSSFKVMLAKQIQDGLEELHRKLLFFDADQISDLIPLLDEQRKFWGQSTEPDFYSDELPNLLDHHLITYFPEIEKYLEDLPEFSME